MNITSTNQRVILESTIISKSVAQVIVDDAVRFFDPTEEDFYTLEDIVDGCVAGVAHPTISLLLGESEVERVAALIVAEVMAHINEDIDTIAEDIETSFNEDFRFAKDYVLQVGDTEMDSYFTGTVVAIARKFTHNSRLLHFFLSTLSGSNNPSMTGSWYRLDNGETVLVAMCEAEIAISSTAKLA